VYGHTHRISCFCHNIYTRIQSWSVFTKRKTIRVLNKFVVNSVKRRRGCEFVVLRKIVLIIVNRFRTEYLFECWTTNINLAFGRRRGCGEQTTVLIIIKFRSRIHEYIIIHSAMIIFKDQKKKSGRRPRRMCKLYYRPWRRFTRDCVRRGNVFTGPSAAFKPSRKRFVDIIAWANSVNTNNVHTRARAVQRLFAEYV